MKNFKVGDKVKVIWNDNEDGKYIGTKSVITYVNESRKYPYTLKGIGVDFMKDEIEIIKKIKVNFILQYNFVEEEDPIEEFETLPQVRSRIKELTSNAGRKVDIDSIRIYEVKNVKKVSVKQQIVIQ